MRRLLVPLLFVALCILSSGAFAMIQTLSTEELVAGSDLIVIASLKSSTEVGKTPEGFRRLDNVLVVAEVLKGEVPPGAELTVATLGGFEDSVEFPAQGKGVLFLKKIEDGRYEVHNLVQGWWPLGPQDTPGGMGTGTSLARLKEIIKGLADGTIQVPPPAPPGEEL